MKRIKTPLLDGLLKYKDEGILRFHMPGHYGKSKFTKILKENLFDIDVTEVNGTDNLSEPNGIIKKSLENIAKIYGAKKSYYLVNGSTSGIYVAIDSLTDFGDEIIVARNSHKSVYSICKKKKLRPQFIYPKIDETFGVDKELEIEDIEFAVKNSNAKVVVLTYPNYYGRAFDIEKIYRFIKSKNMYLIVDSAHGSTFAFSDDLPEVATKYSDICIHSLHKTLPAFTQISLLSINDRVDEKIIEENIRFYQTTSPSYILMTSGEVAVATMEANKKELARIKGAFEKAKTKLEKNSRIKVYNSENQDFGKLFIRTDLDGKKLNDILRKEYKIQCEMVIGNSILFMLGITHSNKDIDYLVNSIIKAVDSQKPAKSKKVISLLPKTTMSDNTETQIIKNKLSGNKVKSKEIPEYNKTKSAELSEPSILKKSIKEVLNENSKLSKKNLKLNDEVKSKDSNLGVKIQEIDTKLGEGRVSAEDIIPYPPGIPILLENEIVNKEVVDTLLYLGIKKLSVKNTKIT